MRTHDLSGLGSKDVICLGFHIGLPATLAHRTRDRASGDFPELPPTQTPLLAAMVEHHPDCMLEDLWRNLNLDMTLILSLKRLSGKSSAIQLSVHACFIAALVFVQ